MRYLIVETSWAMMSLSQALSESGLLLSRTDRPEDIAHFLKIGELDAIILEAETLASHGLSLPSLRASFPQVSIALIADKPDRSSIANWLQAGADTVVGTETPSAEIGARVSAVARRAHGFASSVLRYGPLQIDIDRRVAQIDGIMLHLTPKVYEVLEYMALRPGELVTRDALLSHVYGLESEPDARVFDVYMCTLRSHLKSAGDALSLQTARGKGFRFVYLDADAQAA